MSIRSKLCVGAVNQLVEKLPGTLFILNLAILARKYFAGFYFGDFNAQI